MRSARRCDCGHHLRCVVSAARLLRGFAVLIDLHTYSRASGGASVDNVVSAARAAGLDAVLFADREASAEVARGIARGTFGDFRVFVGVELSTRGGDAILVLPQIDPYLTREEWRELIAFGRPTLEDVVLPTRSAKAAWCCSRIPMTATAS